MERQNDPETVSGPVGRFDDRLKRGLTARARDISFFQAVRLIEASMRAAGETAVSEIGGRTRAGDEPVRLRVAQGTHFPEAEISGASARRSDGRLDLFVQMMGLLGPSGVLPIHYSEYAVQRQRRRDNSFVEFLDLFHHRTLSLFYRSWKKYRLDTNLESTGADGRDAVSSVIAAVFGLYAEGLRNRMSVRDVSLFGYAGMLSRRANAETLEVLISDATGTTAEIVPFQGGWISIAQEDQTRLSGRGESNWGQLGQNAIAGRSYWDVQRKFRIRIGPTNWATFEKFLPGGALYRRAVDIARLAVGPGLDFDFEILVPKVDVPPMRLSADVGGARLGWTTWLPEEGGREVHRRAIIPSSLSCAPAA